MELRQVNYFLIVAKHLNFTRAADELFITQSTLSEQIRKLEEECDCKLFERNHRKVVLTTEGHQFRIYADKISHLAEEAKNLTRENQGKIRFGALPTVILSWLRLVMSEFQEQFPNAQLVMHEMTSSQVEKSILNYLIDFGIMTLPTESTNLQTTFMYDEELVLITPDNHPLTTASKKSFGITDVSDYPFIVYGKHFELRNIILRAFLKENRTINAQMECESTESIKHLVQSGLGVALVPYTSLLYSSSEVLPPTFKIEPTITRTVGIVTRENAYQPKIVKKFLDWLVSKTEKNFRIIQNNLNLLIRFLTGNRPDSTAAYQTGK